MNDDDNSKRKITPVGGAKAKSPADRIAQIEAMRQAMEVDAPKAKSAPTAPPVAVGSVSQPTDGFKVERALLVNEAHKPSRSEQVAFGKAQKDVDAVFGVRKGEIAPEGPPWKIISFLEVAPALFEPKKPLAAYEPLIAKNAIITAKGMLFEVGLKAKDGSEPLQKRQVLVDADGKLCGAECASPRDLDRLLAFPGFFPLGVAGVAAKTSERASFEVMVSKKETLYFNNFGMPVKPSSNRTIHDFKARYQLDEYEAAL